MVGKPGSQPPPSAAKAFNTASSGKSSEAATPLKTTKQAATLMSPSPGGTSGGWSPPLGAKVAADRTKFAQQLADAKAKAASVAKPAPEKQKTTSQAFNSKATVGQAKTAFNSAAPKGATRAAFNSSSKSGGKGGLSR